MSNPFTGFHPEDFDVFHIPGLEPRMEALISRVRPKLEQLGTSLAPVLSVMCGEEMFPHVARHARRTVNPPDDTWVAFANQKRGYKALPHFQIGMWSTHVFIQFAVIYESVEYKRRFAKALKRDEGKMLRGLPGHYYWSYDHMKPAVTYIADMTEEERKKIPDELIRIKKREALCGLRIDREDPSCADGERFLQIAEETFHTLLPLYRAAFGD